jgi:hypothetical protein
VTEGMTLENWNALLAAMRDRVANNSSITLSTPETAAVLHELEALGGSEFLTVTDPPPKPLERAV